jgi:aminoglycoside phosphotransferase (APT) family kinase protein
MTLLNGRVLDDDLAGAVIIREKVDPRLVLGQLGLPVAPEDACSAGRAGTTTWRVESGGEVLALRLFPPEEEWLRRREVMVIRAAAAGGLPAPRVLAEGQWRGRPALLLSWFPGVRLEEELRSRPERVRVLAEAAAGVLARLHNLPAPGSLRREDPDWVAVGSVGTPLQDRLRALGARQASFLHLAYHPLRLFVEGDQVSGVPDWSQARAGDPRADVARAVVLLRVSLLEDDETALAACVRPFERAFLHAYQRQAGPLGDMAPFSAWAWAMTAREYAAWREEPGLAFRPGVLVAIENQRALWAEYAGFRE